MTENKPADSEVCSMVNWYKTPLLFFFCFSECDRCHLPGRANPSGVPRQAMFYQVGDLTPPSLSWLTSHFRLLSQSVHQTLKQLQKEQYEARVAQLVKRNKVFYRLWLSSLQSPVSRTTVLFLFFSILIRIRKFNENKFSIPFRRQRICESSTAFVIIVSFSGK